MGGYKYFWLHVYSLRYEKIPQDKALTGFIETYEIAGSGT